LGHWMQHEGSIFHALDALVGAFLVPSPRQRIERRGLALGFLCDVCGAVFGSSAYVGMSCTVSVGNHLWPCWAGMAVPSFSTWRASRVQMSRMSIGQLLVSVMSAIAFSVVTREQLLNLCVCLAVCQGGQLTPIDLLVEERFHRAAPRGMGGTKCAGNYSPVRSLSVHLLASLFAETGRADAHGLHIFGLSVCPICPLLSAGTAMWVEASASRSMHACASPAPIATGPPSSLKANRVPVSPSWHIERDACSPCPAANPLWQPDTGPHSCNGMRGPDPGAVARGACRIGHPVPI
jgi:hypothetical protein